MRVIQVHNGGSHRQFEIVEKESNFVKSDELKIKVTAFALTTGDLVIINSSLIKLKKPLVPGQFFVGIVEEIGAEIDQYSQGDKILGAIKGGAASEFIVVKNNATLLKLNNQVDDFEALSLLFGGSASLHFLNKKINLTRKSKICIYGASGEVGGIALEYMKAKGHHVTAVASVNNFKKLVSSGADQFIDYRKDDVYSYIHDFDVIFDAVGKLDVEHLISKMKNEAIFVTTQVNLKLIKHYLRGKIFKKKRVVFGFASMTKNDLEELINLNQVGLIKGKIDAVFKMNEFDKAYERVQSGKKNGTVIIKIQN